MAQVGPSQVPPGPGGDGRAGTAPAVAPAPAPAPVARSGFARSMVYEQERRKRWWVRLLGWFMVLIGMAIPGLLIAYYGWFATERYVSEAQFVVRSSSSNVSFSDTLSQATGIASSGGMLAALQDAFVVREFAHSQELVDQVDAEIGMAEIFSYEWVDWWSRLDPDATREEKHDYWQYRISADLDATNGLITLKVSAFTPEQSLQLANAILAACQQLVNKISEESRRDALAFAEGEVRKAEDELKKARAAVTDFRRKTGDIFPEASAKSQLELIAHLEFELAKSKAELAAIGLDRRAPAQRTAEARIAALERQVAEERAKLTANAAHIGSNEPISDVLVNYQALEVDMNFAQEFYMRTLGLLEGARQEAIRAQRYLAVSVRPGLAQEPLEPRREWAIATVIACALAGYIVLGVLYKTIREHVV